MPTTIDDFEIPSVLLSELGKTVDQVKSGPLLALAKLTPALSRGLRLTPANSKFIRQRLAARLLEPGRLSDEIRQFLAQEGLNGELVMVLSKAVLSAGLTELLAIYGRERLLAALLVDSRIEVRQLAIDYCRQAGWQGRPLPDRLTAVTTLTETLRPFLHSLADMRPEEPIVACSTDSAEEGGQHDADGYRRRIADLEERLRNIRAEQKTDRKIDAKVEVLKRQAVDLEEKLARERQGRLTAEAAQAQATARIDELLKAQDEAVRSGIEAEMQSVVRGWLAGPERLDKAVDALAAGADTDILARVQTVLATQAERDRHYGHRTLLRQRLADLREAESTLLQAAAESLNPLPEMAPLVAELRAEAGRLEALLEESVPESVVTRRFAALIKQAEDQEALTRIKGLLQDLETHGCLSPEECRLLYREYHGSLERLFDRFAPAPLPVIKESDPLLVVKRGFSGGGRFRWLLDGYNILFGLPELFAASYEDNHPALKARQLLLAMVDRGLAGTEGLADVFFDGELSAEENFSPRVKAVYSGGGGAGVRNRADQAIIAALESQAPGAVPCVVVSNDRELTERCRALGARVMPLAQFAAILVKG